MRSVFAIAALGLLAAACTPPEVDYCQAAGAPPSDMAACTQYYFQQEAAFRSDLAVCSVDADRTYPPSLYSGWGTALVHRHYGYGGFSSVEQVSVPPDQYRNAQLDGLRMQIIEPCMQSRGWNSGSTWQAGRHDVRKAPARARSGGSLPWRK